MAEADDKSGGANDAGGAPRRLNFVEQIVEEDLRTGKWGGRVNTRFPPEPNGYLHIGHSKSIHLNFGLAQRYGGAYVLRFDDTNPIKEEQEYIDAIVEDVRWLGYDLDGRVLFASDYFQQMYDWAVQLVRAGKAYVCDLSAEEVRTYRGTLTSPGKNSPHRDRAPEENLDLLERMRAGEFPDGSRTLRAKIDMASPNMNLRDPAMYRILHEAHPRTHDAWCIYPMYDWAHGLEDAIEGITHSICTLEFENHRPLYDWFLEQLAIHHPQQIEFAKLILNYTVMSKRKLIELVTGGHVSGWDDPRMPTLRGMRRRGVTSESIRTFCSDIGVAKFNSTINVSRLEFSIRDDLNRRAPRVMAVLDPLKVVIVNYPEGETEELDAVNNPEDPSAGKRKVPFARELYIERKDFMEDPPRKFFRLGPGREVRLRYAYFITCQEAIKDAAGNITELRCTYDPATRGGDAPDGRKVKGTLHWVSATHAVDAEVRLYDRLFIVENPNKTEDGQDWKEHLNPDSLTVVENAKLEPNWRDAADKATWSDNTPRVQFERTGYFALDADTEPAGKPVFNRTVTLRDTWAKIARK